MPAIPGLRGLYSRVGRLVYFGRMLDKIRLHSAGSLPADYQSNMGIGFDARCCTFLRVNYADVVTQVNQGGSDQAVLAWCEAKGGVRTDDECNMWCRFMMKIGWRDDRTAALKQRIVEYGLVGRPIETFFDLNEFDEGRDPVATQAWLGSSASMVILVMGVSGSGKTTIGQLLAEKLGWDFMDADDVHPPGNIAKMAAGQPLDDEDRAPWLADLRERIERYLKHGKNAVVTCSALKERYRRIIVADPALVKIVHLHGTPELLRSRISGRSGHFMAPTMLDSQLAALEPPSNALTVDIAQTPEEIVAQIRRELHV